MRLEDEIRARRRERDILIMSHVVLGYPTLAASEALADSMVAAGVELIELQLPFSEPIADGAVILRANAEALRQGVTVAQCLEVAARLAARHRVGFLATAYYNTLFRRGIDRVVGELAACGLSGVITPDCPPEEGEALLAAMERHGLAAVPLVSPRTPDARLRHLGRLGSGLVYAVAREGVTGGETHFAEALEAYLTRVRAATSLPLAVGFGVKTASDVAFLIGKADIAVVGSQTLRVLDRDGLAAARAFLAGLRPAAR
jgi:tryptophan synthase alpha chain